MKEEYNSNISAEIELFVSTNKTIFIKHCSVCDILGEDDIFLAWLKIIEAGSKVKITEKTFSLDLKHITPELSCTRCTKKLVTQVIFEWIFTDDSENKT